MNAYGTQKEYIANTQNQVEDEDELAHEGESKKNFQQGPVFITPSCSP